METFCNLDIEEIHLLQLRTIRLIREETLLAHLLLLFDSVIYFNFKLGESFYLAHVFLFLSPVFFLLLELSDHPMVGEVDDRRVRMEW